MRKVGSLIIVAGLVILGMSNVIAKPQLNQLPSDSIQSYAVQSLLTYQFMPIQNHPGDEFITTMNNAYTYVLMGQSPLHADVKLAKEENGHRFIFTVENTSDKKQTIGLSGKKYDYILYQDKEKIKQYSEGKLFTKQFEKTVLKPDESMELESETLNLAPGSYKIDIWLADNEYPGARVTEEFIVEEPSEASSGTPSIVAGSLQPSITYKQLNGEEVQVTYTIKNQTEREVVLGVSGKEYDYTLYKDGKQIRSYSEGKEFTHEFKEIAIAQGEEHTVTTVLDNLEPGNYTIEFWLKNKNVSEARVQKDFVVE
ncbi:BsuPI-related putative proteinase inhibitor [Pontibacillus salicampi]|uniref:Intracellular proteinase inhibitor BsuPI domain-containing protein n=1 Tax=Pontibacillus salicampi TaxID=1449801 RepID=A0ABV6LIC5_9BACI